MCVCGNQTRGKIGLLSWQDCYAVIRGGAEETKALLQNRFDHIFYTGKCSHHDLITTYQFFIVDILFCRCNIGGQEYYFTPELG